MWGLPLSTSFSLPGITNRAEGTLSRNSSSFKQLGAFRSSHVQENQDKTLSLPVWHCTACAVISALQPLSTMFIAPQQALLPHAPHPGQSLLKSVGAWLSTREKSEKPNPWWSVYMLRGSHCLRSPPSHVTQLSPWGASAHRRLPWASHLCPSATQNVTEVGGHAVWSQRWLLCLQQSSFPKDTGTFSCCHRAAFYVFGITKHIGQTMICLEQDLKNTK